MISDQHPARGKLLISEPFMMDPIFKRSVVYMTEHNKEGSSGFILNQRSGFLLSDLTDDFEECRYQVFVGGPAGQDSLFFLHTLGAELAEVQEVSPGIYWGGNLDILKIILSKRFIPEDQIKFFIGYSGWAPGQLAGEMQQNAWIVAESSFDSIFSDRQRGLWNETVVGLGTKYAPMLNFPEDPNLN